MKHVLMVAAENGALKGAKVGGMADVICDLPHALAGVDICADVIMPSYGFLTDPELIDSQLTELGVMSVPFGGRLERVGVFSIPHPLAPRATIYLLEHGLWWSTPGKIYSPSSMERPFADDATKFAFLCASVATALVHDYVPKPSVLHLHDWHAACLALLRAFDPQYRALQEIECVFSVHNLALQGTRPLHHDASSLAAWFPQLFDALSLVQQQQIIDPRYAHCVNPMRMGITLSDRVHLVSPTYAKEVLSASMPQNGFFGGEGLEQDLQLKAQRGQVVGILNGCVYDQATMEHPAEQDLMSRETGRLEAFQQLLSHIETTLIEWQAAAQQVSPADMIALTRLQALWRQTQQSQTPMMLLTSVGRLTDQKVLILRHQLPSGLSVLETLLQWLKQLKPTGLFILLGSGDVAISRILQAIAAKYDNFLFLNGYHSSLPEHIYREGDLFVMPSSFEPCGISQMLAMRAGQPCLVHGVGGLKDTVQDGINGFVFNGVNLDEQAQAMLAKLAEAVACFELEKWADICAEARAARFEWHRVAQQYRQQLYFPLH